MNEEIAMFDQPDVNDLVGYVCPNEKEKDQWLRYI